MTSGLPPIVMRVSPDSIERQPGINERPSRRMCDHRKRIGNRDADMAASGMPIFVRR